MLYRRRHYLLISWRRLLPLLHYHYAIDMITLNRCIILLADNIYYAVITCWLRYAATAFAAASRHMRWGADDAMLHLIDTIYHVIYLIDAFRHAFSLLPSLYDTGQAFSSSSPLASLRRYTFCLRGPLAIAGQISSYRSLTISIAPHWADINIIIYWMALIFIYITLLLTWLRSLDTLHITSTLPLHLDAIIYFYDYANSQILRQPIRHCLRHAWHYATPPLRQATRWAP